MYLYAYGETPINPGLTKLHMCRDVPNGLPLIRRFGNNIDVVDIMNRDGETLIGKLDSEVLENCKGMMIIASFVTRALVQP